jgi:hypothetical protein
MHKLPPKWGVQKWHLFGTFFMKKNAKKIEKKGVMIVDFYSNGK